MKTNEIEYFEEVEETNFADAIKNVFVAIGLAAVVFAVWFTLNYVDGLMASMIK